MNDSNGIAAHVAERLRSFQKELQACDDELHEDFSEIPGSESTGDALQANLELTGAYWEA